LVGQRSKLLREIPEERQAEATPIGDANHRSDFPSANANASSNGSIPKKWSRAACLSYPIRDQELASARKDRSWKSATTPK